MPRLFTDSQFTARRRKLRRQQSPAELILWRHLRNRGLNGYKIRRQHSAGYFVVDFFCPSARLVIEVDGESHLTLAGIQKNQQRDAWLRRHGVRVMHFTNYDVLQDLQTVLGKISQALLPNPSSTRRGVKTTRAQPAT